MFSEQAMPESLYCGAFGVDLKDNCIISGDENFLLITGYSEENIEKHKISLDKLIYEADHSFVFCALQSSAENNNLFANQCRITLQNDRYISVFLYGFIKDRIGQFIIHDIVKYDEYTDCIMKMRDESIYLVDTLLANVSCPIFNFSEKDGVFGFVSDSLVEMLEFTPENFAAEFDRNFYNIVYPEDREHVKRSVKEQAVSSEHIEVSFRAISASHNVLWVIFRGRQVEFPEDHKYFGSLVDITELRLAQDKLSEINLQMETLISNIPGGVASCMFDGGYLRLLYANDEFYRLLGYTKTEYDAKPDNDISTLIYEKDYKVIEEYFKRPVKEDSPIEYEVRIHTQDRGLIWFSIRARFYKYIYEKPVYYSVILDISDRKKMESELRIQTERYKLIESITEEIQFEYDVFTDTIILPKKRGCHENTDNLLAIPGFFRGSLIKKIIYKEDAAKIKNTLQEAVFNQGKGVLEFRARLYENNYKWQRLHFVTVAEEDGTVIRVVGRLKDIDEERQRQDSLEQRIKADPLTNLLNKVAIKYSIDKYISADQEDSCHAILLIDIDNFKCVNDTLGHIMGDNAIQDIAGSMKAVFRSSDFLGRVGGDEFLVFMKGTSTPMVKEKAKVLCERINRVYSNERDSVHVSCSVGIAIYPYDGETYEELFSKADLAMYYSKMKGGNVYVSYEEIIENI